MNDEQKARVIANCEVIAKALRDGKALQWRDVDAHEWLDDEDFPSVHPDYEYRIKPEPRTIWVNEYPSEGPGIHATEDDARRCASANATRIAVEYREVVK